MAAGGQPVRTLRRGPAPIASFDHDNSDESSPETKQTFRLPEIREDPVCSHSLAPGEQRARSHSTPAGGLHAAAPRIDISRASSSSHHDSRDSSPELALFAGGDDSRARLELGFREDGALELRSSTEELAFLEPAPGERAPPPAARAPRRDSQGSEAALLAVSGRTSRLSSVGSQCSAHSALSALSALGRVSRLSVASGASRSPSPHRMLLETSFCGPKPIETDPEICAAAVEERLLEIAKLTAASPLTVAPPVDARDRREVRTEATVERDAPRSQLVAPPDAPPVAPPVAPPDAPPVAPPDAPTVAPPVASPAAPPVPPTLPAAESSPPSAEPSDDDKRLKETQNRARAHERRARPRVRREPSEPEVYKSGNRTKDIIRIKLKPDDEYEEGEERSASPPRALRPTELQPAVGPAHAGRPTDLQPAVGPAHALRPPRDSRTPSPSGPPVSRKSSFCSLFKSRETITSPDSPSDALRRKRSLTEGRSRSKSRDRSATPSSAGKIRGSVLSLFRTPRRGAASPSPSSREGSPVVQPQRQITPPQPERARRADRLKYYEDAKDGIIHIPLRTPPDERPTSDGTREAESECAAAEVTLHRERPRPASAPQPRATSARDPATTKPTRRTVLPDGSIIIPLRSPTECTVDGRPQSPRARSASETTTAGAAAADGGPLSSTASDETVAAPNGPSPPRDRPAVVAPETPSASERVEAAAPAPANDEARHPRKERIVFTTHVGSAERVFRTQFSITKTPSVTSEVSGSFLSFAEGEEERRRDAGASEPEGGADGPDASRARDSSESEPSSESGGNDAERRGLVVQESFEDELPYVPTTLPLERSLALPMVPVRDRGGVRVAGVERPRGAVPAPPPPACRPAPRPLAPRPTPPEPAADRLRIRLPRRPRAASAATVPAPPRLDRTRTRSGSDGGESRSKTEWIDFEELPERRKQPKRIQTLPDGGVLAAEDVLFSYVEPDQCRCECHAHDTTPTQKAADSSTSQECGEEPSRPAGPRGSLCAAPCEELH